ncbi:O-antigen ligase family protein [Acinetobacter sp. C26M]|uniref:O-antigen ligase family protein n=1 Tax=unclassified Acinetobacter TaxID=196816 RepID=UPI002036E041|nr:MULTISPECIES: O-antigen ligase family protein [unclassified Acinetobacter]USA46485.1 O-antigen ligase family protein [Acinetobacter sp. C26M]USA49969.1 O-antigen ligase family protein [Acinetobacter sp. C26G]
MNTTKTLQKGIVFGLLSSLVLPFFNFFGFGLYLTTIISIFLFLFVFLYKIKIDKFSIIIFLICFLVFLSTLHAGAFGLSSDDYRNYIEVVKYFQFLPYLILFNSINKKGMDKVIIDFIEYSVFLYLLVFLLQLINPANIGYLISAFYLGDGSSHLVGVESGQRPPITGSNPNSGAVIGSFFLFFYVTQILKKITPLNLAISGLLLLSIVMTQSRTTLAGLAVCIVVFVLLSKGNFKFKISLVFSIPIIGFFIYTYLNLDYIKYGIQYLSEGNNDSVNVRLDTFQIAKQAFLKSPWFGTGPSKDEFGSILDSEYVLIFMRYGLLGCLVFTIFIISLLWSGFRNINRDPGLILFLYTILTLVVMLTNNAYSGYQLMSITILLIIWLRVDAEKK